MANKNIQMRHKNGSGWDNLLPITHEGNVFDDNGEGLPAKLGNKVDKKEIRVSMFSTARNFSFDCWLIQVGEKNILIDFAMHGDALHLADKIKALGVNKIHISWITHYHGDHIGGLERFFTESGIDFSETEFYVPPQADWSRLVDSGTGSTAAVLAQRESTSRSLINQYTPGFTVMTDGMKVDIDEHTSVKFFNVGDAYWTHYYNAQYNDGSHGPTTDYNDFSIMSLFNQGDTNILLTSDLAYTAQGRNAKNVPTSVDLYQIPHHGLDKKVHPEWAKRIDTNFAFIYNNRTDGSIMSRNEYASISQRGGKIYNTFMSGDCTYRHTPEGSEVISEKGVASEGLHSYSLGGSILIDQGDDLNNYNTPGTYVSDTAGRSASILNTPSALASGGFKLVTEYYHHETRRRQTLYEITGRGHIYYRVFSTNNQWNPWHRLMTDRDFNNNTVDDGSVRHRFSSGANLNDFTTVGKYASDTSGLTATITNKPSDLSSGFTLEVIPLHDAARFHQLIRVNNGACDVYMRSFTGAWNPWHKVTKTQV